MFNVWMKYDHGVWAGHCDEHPEYRVLAHSREELIKRSFEYLTFVHGQPTKTIEVQWHDVP